MKLPNDINRYEWIIGLFCIICLMPSVVYGQVAFRNAASASILDSNDITHIGTDTGFARLNCGNVNPVIPNGITGDLLLALVIARENGAVVTMAGWNLAYSDSYPGQEFQVFIYWRIATGGDPSTVNQSGTCNTFGAKISRFRGVDPTQPFVNNPVLAINVVRQNSGNMDTGTVNTTIDRSMLVVAGFINDDRTVSEGAGWNTSYDATLNIWSRDIGLSLHYQLQTNAGSASVANWDLSGGGSDENYGVILALRPAAAQLTINAPPGTVANDVMIASVTMRPCSSTNGGACTATITPPIGWTLVNTIDRTTGGGFGNRLYSYLRVTSNSEPANYTWELGGTPSHTGAVGGIISFSGVDTSNPVVVQAGQSTTWSLTHTAPSIDTGMVINTMLVSTHVTNSSASWVPPAGMTEAVDVASHPVPDNLGIALEINYQSHPFASPTGNRTATHSNPPTADTGATHILALRPIFAAIPSSFNVFESNTPVGAITGRLFTKLVGNAFGFDVVAISGGAQLATFNDQVIVELIANTVGAAIDVNNCPLTFAVIQTVTPNATISGGRTLVNFSAIGSASRDVRVRVRYPANSPTVTNCSADNFSIRPTALMVSSTNATQTDSSGVPIIKTGAHFNLMASAAVGYDGAPIIDNTKILGSSVAGNIGGNFNVAMAATGVATGASFFYTEVGNFGLDNLAVFDTSFTAVDQPGDCTSDFSNFLVGDQYGCSFGSITVPQVTGSSGFGRFVPDNYTVSFNVPQFKTICDAGMFTYIGQPFAYNMSPVMTVTARNGTNNGLTNTTTLNYSGSYVKLTNASLIPNTQAARYTRFDTLGSNLTPILDTSVMPAVTADPVISTFVNGVGTLTFSSGATGLAFARSSSAPNAQFNADIMLAINVIDADGVTFAGNPASFGAATAGNGIIFSNGKDMRFGRLRLQNALGSELLSLPVPILAQYWNGIGFVTNTQDHCTQIITANVGLTNFLGNISAGETTATTGVAFNAGIGELVLSAPGIGNNGSVELVINLGANSIEAPCGSLAPDPVTTGANNRFLQGKWCGADYEKDPTARITFGIYKGASEIIYMREQY